MDWDTSHACFLLEVLYSGATEEGDWNQMVPLVMATDCKSIYDCIYTDNQSISDKSNALNVAVLRLSLVLSNPFAVLPCNAALRAEPAGDLPYHVCSGGLPLGFVSHSS